MADEPQHMHVVGLDDGHRFETVLITTDEALAQRIIDEHPEMGYELSTLPVLTDAAQWHDTVCYSAFFELHFATGNTEAFQVSDRPHHVDPYVDGHAVTDQGLLRMYVYDRTPDKARARAEALLTELQAERGQHPNAGSLLAAFRKRLRPGVYD